MEFFYSDFWFLRYLFVFYLILGIWNVVVNRINTRASIKLGMIIILGTISAVILGKIPYIKESVSTWYYLWFIVGLIIFVWQSKQVSSLLKTEQSLKTGICSFIGLVTVCLLALFTTISSRLICVGMILFLSVFCISMKNYWPQKTKLFLIRTGNNTLPIYGIHWCLLFSPFFRIGIYKLWSVVPVFISSVLTAVIWMIICMLLIKLGSSNKTIRAMFLGK